VTYQPHKTRTIAPSTRRVQVRDSVQDMMTFAGSSPLNFYTLCGRTPTHQQALWLGDMGKEWLSHPSKRNKRWSIRSGKGIGKTEAVGAVAGSWVCRYPYCKWFQTAPKMAQLTSIFIATFGELLRGAPPTFQRFFKIQATSVGAGGQRADRWGITTGTSAKDVSAQGLHNDHLAIGVDEAAGVPRAIYNAMADTLSNEDSLLLLTGNANNRDSPFYDSFFGPGSDRWVNYCFSSEESPIVSKDNIRQLEADYGRDSDYFRVAVLGEFPRNSTDAIIDADGLIECTRLDPWAMAAVRDPALLQYRQVGIDLARMGADESVVVMRQGSGVVLLKAFSKQEPLHVVRWAFGQQAAMDWPTEETLYMPDADGMGQGVMGSFKDAQKRFSEFRSQHTSSRTDFHNKATQAWFHLASLVKRRAIAIPRDSILMKQLTLRTYKFHESSGTLVVLPKDKEVAMGRMSPDRADALVLACFQGGIERPKMIRGAVRPSPDMGSSLRRQPGIR